MWNSNPVGYIKNDVKTLWIHIQTNKTQKTTLILTLPPLVGLIRGVTLHYVYVYIMCLQANICSLACKNIFFYLGLAVLGPLSCFWEQCHVMLYNCCSKQLFYCLSLNIRANKPSDTQIFTNLQMTTKVLQRESQLIWT